MYSWGRIRKDTRPGVDGRQDTEPRSRSLQGVRVLVTNDDGVDSIGIQRLAAGLATDERFEVTVVAPDGDRSGMSAALAMIGGGSLIARRVELPEAPGVEAWALDSTPAMCVMSGRLGGFGEPPDLIVSGINAGLNTGRAVFHSGTVCAALTAQNFGVSGLAVSLQGGEIWHWDTAVALALETIDKLLAGPPRSVLNLNVPSLELSEVKGIRWARLAPFGEVRMMMTGHDVEPDETGERARHISAELQISEVSFESDTDTGLVREGFAALTTLVGVTEAWPTDLRTGAGTTTPGDLDEQLVPGAPLHPSHQLPDADQHGTLHRPIIGAGPSDEHL